MKTQIIEEHDENLDELIARARRDSMLQELMHGNSIFQGLDWFVKVKTLLDNIEVVIGRDDKNWIKSDPEGYGDKRSSYLMAFAYGLIGKTYESQKIFKSISTGHITLADFASLALCYLVVGKEDMAKEALKRVGKQFKCYKMSFNSCLYADKKMRSKRADANAMLALAYYFSGDKEKARQLRYGITLHIEKQNSRNPGVDMVPADDGTTKKDLCATALATAYDYFYCADQQSSYVPERSSKTIEEYFGLTRVDYRTLVGKNLSAIENASMAVLYFAEGKLNETKNNQRNGWGIG